MNETLLSLLAETRALLEKLKCQITPHRFLPGDVCMQCRGTVRLPDPAYDGLREVVEWARFAYILNEGKTYVIPPPGALEGALTAAMPDGLNLETRCSPGCGYAGLIRSSDGSVLAYMENQPIRDIASLKAVNAYLAKEVERGT